MWRHGYFVWVALWRLGWAFLRANRYVKRRLLQDLNLPQSVALSPKELGRIRHYVFGSTFLRTVFDTMRRSRLNRAELQRLSSLAALASYFDDLVEIADASSTNVGSFGASADKRGIAIHLLAQVRAELPSANRQLFEQCLQQVFLIETAVEKPVDLATLRAHAAEKGGASVLLFRSLFEPVPSPKEQDALRFFGHMIQFSDDVLDVWFDEKAGIKTTATHLIGEGQLHTLSLEYELQVSQTNRAFRQLPVSKYRVSLLLAMINTLVAVVRTCLYRYAQLEKQFGRLPIQDRHQMVLDMAKWRNRMVAARCMLRPLKNG